MEFSSKTAWWMKTERTVLFCSDNNVHWHVLHISSAGTSRRVFMSHPTTILNTCQRAKRFPRRGRKSALWSAVRFVRVWKWRRACKRWCTFTNAGFFWKRVRPPIALKTALFQRPADSFSLTTFICCSSVYTEWRQTERQTVTRL